MLSSWGILASLIIPVVHCASSAPPSSKYGTLKFQQNGNVTTATFDNPPINLVDSHLISDFHDFLVWLQPQSGKTTPKVVVFNSANPDYFLSHTDLRLLQTNSTLPNATQSLNAALELGPLLVNTTSTAFIASINGRTTGFGNELALHMDMRYAGPQAFAVNFENSIGLAAGGGGQLFSVPLVGRAKAIEHLLGALGYDCQTGQATGLFNYCYGSAAALSSNVSTLAGRIGLLPQHSLNDTKTTLNNFYPTIAQQQDELNRLFPLLALPSEQAIIKQFLQLSSNQTNTTFEYNIPASIFQAFYNYTTPPPTV